jgi:hypothetical protein
MGSGSASNSITIDEDVSIWYAQTISREALSSIPDYFKKIPTFETLNFKHRKDLGPAFVANLPQEASPMVLEIGFYDCISSDKKPPVYAFVHGPKKNFVGYFFVKPDSSIFRVKVQSDLYDVEVSEPFCDLSDLTVGTQTVCNRIRAVVLHYFLAAGYMKELANYRSFWQDFTKSCAYIANKGNRPKRKTEVQGQNFQLALAAVLVPDTDSVVSKLDTAASKKRTADEQSEVAPGKL